MKIEGLQAVVAQLRAKAVKTAEDNVDCVVGYTAAYALYVHENIEMKLQGEPRGGGRGFFWDPQGRAEAKFLEGPARTMGQELAGIISEAMGKGKTMAQGLLLAGLRLQRESMLLVPVDTGNLKNSAFTRIEPREA